MAGTRFRLLKWKKIEFPPKRQNQPAESIHDLSCRKKITLKVAGFLNCTLNFVKVIYGYNLRVELYQRLTLQRTFKSIRSCELAGRVLLCPFHIRTQHVGVKFA